MRRQSNYPTWQRILSPTNELNWLKLSLFGIPTGLGTCEVKVESWRWTESSEGSWLILTKDSAELFRLHLVIITRSIDTKDKKRAAKKKASLWKKEVVTHPQVVCKVLNHIPTGWLPKSGNTRNVNGSESKNTRRQWRQHSVGHRTPVKQEEMDC